MPLEVIILAAGKGTRMRSHLPKVLHQIGGQTMLQRVVETALTLSPTAIHIVTGHGSELVTETLQKGLTASGVSAADRERIQWVLQATQNGTGDAVKVATPHVDNASSCLILCGDVPLIERQTLQDLCTSTAALTVLTSIPDNVSGLGRIVRDDSDNLSEIVEQKDASAEQLEIREINTGIMHCQARQLKNWLARLENNNQSGEYYLTDIVALAVADGFDVDAQLANNAECYLGVNSKANLATAERAFQAGEADRLMQSGVTVMDPARLDIRGEVVCGSDCVIDVNVVLQGKVQLGNNVTIGPNCVIINAIIGDNTEIAANCVIEDAVLADACHIGPFARLRPQTDLASGVRIGNFVEVKKSTFGVGSKANHLAYVGDSSVGSNVNIGAGVITCNYDGANKHQTVIGDDVFVGSDSQLVAPVNIGNGATIGAGTTLTKNVEAGSLVITRAPHKSLKSWQRPVKKF